MNFLPTNFLVKKFPVLDDLQPGDDSHYLPPNKLETNQWEDASKKYSNEDSKFLKNINSTEFRLPVLDSGYCDTYLFSTIDDNFKQDLSDVDAKTESLPKKIKTE